MRWYGVKSHFWIDLREIGTVEYRTLGKTGLRISEIGFGCGPTAGLMVAGSPEERLRAVSRALELGINYFDTAPVYGDGLSETHLGEALKDLGADALVGTKVALRSEDLGDISGSIVRSVEGSLRRLKRESTDILHLHNRVALERPAGAKAAVGPLITLDEILGPRGILETFEALRRQGKVRFFGLCAFGGEVTVITRLLDSGRFRSLLVYYNILNPTAGRPAPAGFRGHDYGRVIDRAAAHGTGVIALRVLAAGALSGETERHPLAARDRGGTDRERDVKRARALTFLTENGKYTLVQTAIRFALMKREISTVLVGFSTFSHLEEAAACSGTSGFDPQALSRLEELYRTDFGLTEL